MRDTPAPASTTRLRGACELGLILLVVATACGINSPGESGRADASRAQQVGIQDMTVELELPDTVQLGEEVPITLRVTNAATEPVELWMTGDPVAFDLFVTRLDGTEVWRRLYGEVVADILQQRLLQPGEAIEFSEQWEQRDNHGSPIAPGTYFVLGVVPAEDLDLSSDRRELVVLP
jgi:hypothetical protein